MGLLFPDGIRNRKGLFNFYSPEILLHMDGDTNSTSFVNSSYKQYTISATGDTKINTTIVKYGTGSAFFDGTNDYLTITNVTSMRLGLGNIPFTIEFWVYRTRTNATEVYFAKHGDTADWNGTTGLAVEFYSTSAGQVVFGLWSGTALVNITNTRTVAANTWTHMAVAYDGTTTRVFVGGQRLTNTSTSSYGNTTSANKLQISGEIGNTFNLNGYIDEFRIVIGQCFYTADFTPPQFAFPNP